MKKMSLYSCLFNNADSYYLFNTETLIKAKISHALYKDLKNCNFEGIDSKLLKILEEKKFIVEEEKQYDFFNKMEIETNRLNYDTNNMTLFLMPTIGCNFCCPYCFEGKKENVSMDKKTIHNIIRFLNNSSAKELSLHWYGGEPLLRFDLMKKIYEGITKETSLKLVSNSIITNGYLINNAILDFFKSTNMNKIQITLDGEKVTHDKKRHLKDNLEGTFDKIISNIKLLSKQLPKSHIYVRVNIDKNNYKEFVNIYHFLHNDCDFNNNIYVYPAVIKVYDKLGEKLVQKCFNNEELFGLFEYYKNNGCEVVFFPKEHKHTCSICNLYTYTIGPNGEIYKCPEDANQPQKIIGNVNTDTIDNESLLLEYINDSSQFKRQECKDCHCFPLCYGGCGKLYLKDKYFHGKINYCHPLKNIDALKRAFLDDIKNSEKSVNSNLQFEIY